MSDITFEAHGFNSGSGLPWGDLDDRTDREKGYAGIMWNDHKLPRGLRITDIEPKYQAANFHNERRTEIAEVRKELKAPNPGRAGQGGTPVYLTHLITGHVRRYHSKRAAITDIVGYNSNAKDRVGDWIITKKGHKVDRDRFNEMRGTLIGSMMMKAGIVKSRTHLHVSTKAREVFNLAMATTSYDELNEVISKAQ